MSKSCESFPPYAPGAQRPRVVVFVGPSLDRDEVTSRLGDRCELEIWDPAGQGDLAAAVVSGRVPHVIALIDGVYEHEPSVWHKEVLWALTQGVWVVGGASMGALRAAELHSFGMIPVGWVAERFMSGELVADEEVAVAHLDGDYGWRAVSEALVSIRATVADAERDAVVSTEHAAELLGAARHLHYPERVWPAILNGAAATVDAASLDRFRQWLIGHKRNVKAEDARAVLERVAEKIGDASRFVPSFAFQSTDQWRAVSPKPSDGCDPHLRDDLHDDVRLSGEWFEVLQSALLRVLAEKLFPVRSGEVLAAWVDAVTARVNPDELKGMAAEAIESMASQQASLDAAWATCGADAVGSVAGVLRIRGEYETRRFRAASVFAANAALGSPDGAIDPRMVGIDEHAVIDELRRIVDLHSSSLGEDDVSVEMLNQCASTLGFDDAESFRRAVLRRLVSVTYSPPISS